MQKLSLECGFCGQKYNVDLHKIPFPCQQCKSTVGQPQKTTLDLSFFEASSNPKPTIRRNSKPTVDPRSKSPSQRYSRLKKIAEGGMGSIYLIGDNTLQRNVVQKSLKRETDKIHREMFLTEAQITSQLEHPNIVPIYDIMEDNGNLHLIMKHVEGQTLHEVIDEVKRSQKCWPINERLLIFEKICQAISYAHDRKIIHRDLKPDNVMIASHGQVYLLDWGIAKNRTINAKSNPQEMVGTPGYMPPEQCRGEQVDIRADIFGLGAILYEMIYLRPAYDGMSPMALLMQTINDPIDFSQKDIKNKLNRRLVSIAQKALEKDRNQRYSNTKRLLQDINAYLNDSEMIAYKDTFFEKICKKTKLRLHYLQTVDYLIIGFLFLALVWFSFANIEKMVANEKYKVYEAQAHIYHSQGMESYQKSLVTSQQKKQQHLLKAKIYWDLTVEAIQNALAIDPQSHRTEELLALEKEIKKYRN
ncbi:serine/threonine protein kinase [Candidatus Uabimicrobium sp. HlEnr_7]|uniref:serine/threonine protein kinase n=1 Tax=Candidatus Uabimicrobium helgolandensis TaxID=3095367 RepID=UPI003556C876